MVLDLRPIWRNPYENDFLMVFNCCLCFFFVAIVDMTDRLVSVSKACVETRGEWYNGSDNQVSKSSSMDIAM